LPIHRPNSGTDLPDPDRFHDEVAVLTITFVRHPVICNESRALFVRLPGKLQENSGTITGA
jgi:hypothetical protein